ncbi:MAG: ATP-binding protein [Candidatus Methanomethylophilaceae archaeon]|nr:ATP-binding protein [Candidatus Methanomethylophilaceae archaeon]
MIIPRSRYLDRLIARKHNGKPKVITGVRRCGKSYLLFNLFRNHLLQSGIDESHIIAIALDSRENEEYRDVGILHKRILSLIADQSMHYVLLDEIQLAVGFESMINSLIRNENLDIYVTGSNSKFLSSDIMTEFRGRGDEVNVRPLSFSEFVSVYEGDKGDALAEYMDYGGLPELVMMKTDEQKAAYLKSLMETTYLKDIIERNEIRLPYLLENLVNVLSSTACSLVNPTKIKDTMVSSGYKSADEDTIVKYIGYLADAFLFEKAVRYDIKGRKYIGALEKYYPVDQGISNARLNFRQTSDRPHIMENVIYNELRSRGFDVDIGVVKFTRTKDGKMTNIAAEVDFIARKGSSATYIQSAYRIDDPEKKEQELRSLLKINDSFKKVMIIGDSMKPNMDENGILFIGLMQFLSDENSLNL